MKINKNIDEKELCLKYENGATLLDICNEYKIGKIKLKKILTKNSIVLRNSHSPKIKRNFIIDDFHIKKYEDTENYYYVAKSKIDGSEYRDCNNNGGHLTEHIRNKVGIEIPTLYDRRIYYQTTGNYWWEQWFDVEKRLKRGVKKCPYCGWETIDIENKSGAFEVHLLKVHKKTIEDYLNEFPEDTNYFSKHKEAVKREKKLCDERNYVYCPICGKKFEKLTYSHIKTHNLSLEEFKEKHPNAVFLSDNMLQQSLEAQKLGNLVVSKKRFISKYEEEIQNFLTENNISFKSNRQILDGKEIDILIPDIKLGIEFDGLKWHTEWFGKKNHTYHLDKTITCNKHGYGLVHIFEDEYVNNKDIVYHKLKHLLKIDNNLVKIYGRKCVIKEIFMYEAKNFLSKYHIQGFVSSSVYLGAYYNENLIAVMTFKNGNIKNDCWELTRFASDYNYVCCGVGGKMFKYFIRHYNPEKIVSFADRRWTISPYNNLYTKLGFLLTKFNPPDYKYYNDKSKDDMKYKRIHKMKLNKQTLHKKYGFPLTMTETEMAKALGYDRIWDCGLIKYVWEREKESK